MSFSIFKEIRRLLKSNIVTAHLLKASAGNESMRHIFQINNNGSLCAYKAEETQEEVGEKGKKRRGGEVNVSFRWILILTSEKNSERGVGI